MAGLPCAGSRKTRRFVMSITLPRPRRSIPGRERGAAAALALVLFRRGALGRHHFHNEHRGFPACHRPLAPMPARLACHRERPDAQLPHVAEGHRRAGRGRHWLGWGGVDLAGLSSSRHRVAPVWRAEQRSLDDRFCHFEPHAEACKPVATICRACLPRDLGSMTTTSCSGSMPNSGAAAGGFDPITN